MWPAEESWAGRLTVCSAGPVDVARRRRIRRRLEALDARPPMPPAAMLFVRRLRVEAPAREASRGALEQGIRDSLAQWYERAARPVDGQADPAAEAVVFPDEATMLACLLADIRRGCAAGFWWWQAVWQRMGVPLRAGEILASRPEHVPAVFRALERMGEAVRVAALLEREQAASLLRAMLGCHAATDLARAIDAARRPAGSIGNFPGAPQRLVAVVTTQEAGLGLAAIPAGLPHSPRGSESLPPENRVLLALSLGLAAAPQVIRSAQFAARAGQWLGAEFAGKLVVPPRTAAERSTGVKQGLATGISPFATVEQMRVKEAKCAGLAVPQIRAAAEFGENAQPIAGSPDISAPTAPPAVVTEAHSTHRWDAAPTNFSHGSIPTTLPGLQAGTRTRIGGALYIIAAFERLGIPDCFEPAWPFSNYLSRWGVLELVARGIVSAVGFTEEYRDDPLWTALAQIDGRDPGLSGFQDFPARDSFRIPAAWLPEILDPDEEFAWAWRQRRIAVWPRAGWLLADRPLRKGERREDAFRAELPPHGRGAALSAERLAWAASPRARLGGELQIAPALSFWLECMLPALRVWLSRAMGIERAGYVELAESLLLVPGELFVTPTRVDFRAPLEQTRIPVRRAALDLDPGWLPAWGRSIRFHYGDASGGLR